MEINGGSSLVKSLQLGVCSQSSNYLNSIWNQKYEHFLWSIYSFIHTKIYTSLNAFIYRKSYSKSRHSFLQLCQHTSFSSALNILQKSFYFIAQKAWVQRSIFKSRMLYFFPLKKLLKPGGKAKIKARCLTGRIQQYRTQPFGNCDTSENKNNPPFFLVN